MPVIHLITIINAPIERCFDIARSIDIHQLSTIKTNEKAIGGVTKGLINQGEQVTWRAKHFGIYQRLTTFIPEMNIPYSFVDVQLKGPFKKLHHTHSFEYGNGQTMMTDIFEFESPMGVLGKIFNKWVLTNYMKRFLTERNQMIKALAESEEWKKYLSSGN